MEKDSRLEGEVAIKGWKGGFDKSCGSIYPHLYDGGFFNCRENYVMNWMLCVLDFGGAKLARKGKFIGRVGVF